MDKKALDFLKSNYITILSTVSKENKPQSAAMLYALDRDDTILFVTHEDTNKARNLGKNNAVSFVVWEEGKMSLQIEGVAERVVDIQQKTEALDVLAKAAAIRKDFFPPILKLEGGDYVIFRITPVSVHCLDLSSGYMKD